MLAFTLCSQFTECFSSSAVTYVCNQEQVRDRRCGCTITQSMTLFFFWTNILSFSQNLWCPKGQQAPWKLMVVVLFCLVLFHKEIPYEDPTGQQSFPPSQLHVGIPSEIFSWVILVGNYYFKIRILSRTLNGFFSLFFFLRGYKLLGFSPNPPHLTLRK